MKVLRQTWLFNRARFQHALSTFRLAPAVQARTRASLQRLRDRFVNRTMERCGAHQITETKAQQAFNTLLFEGVLDYQGLLGDRLPYSLLPEVTHGRSRSDLAIGLFQFSSASVSAVVELKSPNADLDAPQKGTQYRSKRTGKQLSPIAQAVEAMHYARVQWALVSNMASICLIHASDVRSCLSIDLLAPVPDVSLLHFAFGPGGFLPIGKTDARLETIRVPPKKKGRP